MVAGDPEALLLTTTDPGALPVAVGLKVTVNAKFCPEVNVTGVVAPLSEYPVPLGAIWEIWTSEFPVFVTVTFCEADPPVVTLPKARLLELKESVLVATMPVPLRATVDGEFGALLTTDTLPLADPADVGANWTLKVLLALGLRDSGKFTVLVPNPLPVTLSCVMVKTSVPVFFSCNV